MYLRSKKKGKNLYYYIVSGKKLSNGKVRQKVIKYLGTIENMFEKYDFWEKNNSQ